MIKNKFLIRLISLILCLFMIFPSEIMALEDIPCESAILIEGIGGKVLFEKNKDEKRAPASITKIMSLLLIMEKLQSEEISLSDKVTASGHAASMGGSQIWLRENEVMTVDELLRASCIASANDAMVALAEFTCGSEESFVSLMNKKADEMGLKNTHFKNCTGLDEEGHYTTAEDISKMSLEILKFPLIKKYSSVWQDELRGGKTQLVNTNRLVRFYKGAAGLKTGTTDNAGCCLAAFAERDDLPLVAVVLGCKNSKDRFDLSRKLLDTGFANYKAVKTPKLNDELSPLRVKRGEIRYAGLKCNMPSFLVTEKDKKAPLKIISQREEFLEAPIEENTPAGSLKIMQGNEILSEIPLTTAYPIGKLSYNVALSRVFHSVFSL